MLKYFWILIFIATISCSNNRDKISGVKYYKSWVGYNHPIKLVDEIDSSQISNLSTYYVGTYEEGQLIRVFKYMHDTIMYKYEYKYDDDGNCRIIK